MTRSRRDRDEHHFRITHFFTRVLQVTASDGPKMTRSGQRPPPGTAGITRDDRCLHCGSHGSARCLCGHGAQPGSGATLLPVSGQTARRGKWSNTCRVLRVCVPRHRRSPPCPAGCRFRPAQEGCSIRLGISRPAGHRPKAQISSRAFLPGVVSPEPYPISAGWPRLPMDSVGRTPTDQ